MAETETVSKITVPVYTDDTAKDNGKKLDTIAVLLSSIAESQRTLANAQPDVSLDVDLNTVRKIVAAGMAPKLYPVGTQLVNTYTDKDGKSYDCPWDVVQPDSTAPAGALLCGFYQAPDKDISTLKVYVYKDQNKSELLETCSISAGSEGTDLGTFQKSENGDLNSLQAAAYGDNRWYKSVYRQYLNSDAAAGAWWSPQDKWDMRPSCADTLPGFLSGFSEEFKNALTRVKVVTYGNTVTDDGGAVATYDKIFLPSLEEIYCTPQVKGEGDYWPYWKEATGATAP